MNRTPAHCVGRGYQAVKFGAGFAALLVGSLWLSACGSADEGSPGLAQTHQAITQDPLAATCGYEVTSGTYTTWPNGYQAWVDLKNVSGPVGTAFSALVDVGGTVITDGALANYTPADGGYLVTQPSWLQYQTIPRGASHRFQFNGSGAFAGVTPYLLSINGVPCDTVLPEVTLAASSGLITSAEPLTLDATASDNVAVRRVVFQDGDQVIGVDTQAPYTLTLSVDAALNGRHHYTATAYDPSENQASSSVVSVLVAIDNKFLGSAAASSAEYTRWPDDFSQLTPGNAGKWGSVEATRDVMDWSGLDAARDFAAEHGLRFKLHTLIWGQQQPAWVADLTPEEQLAEIDEWMSLLAERYGDVDMIDVVNEPLHAPPAYAEALGGAGATGWDWVIKSFEMARAHFPNSELLLNDYNILVLDSFTTDYLNVINLLKARGLIDGIGEQGHFLERAELPVVAGNLERLAATGLPLYISELDINFADDARQAKRMSELVPLFWENPSVLGVTHWGFVEGYMWQENAALMHADGTARPALDWLRCYLSGEAECPVPEYIPQPRTGNAAGLTLEAEDYDEGHGLLALGSVVAYIDAGDSESFSRVQFNANWDSLAITYAKGNTDLGSATIYLDSVDSAPLATVELPSTGGWGTSATVTVPIAPTAGEHELIVVYGGGYGVGNIDRIALLAPAGRAPSVIANGDFEVDASGWYTWGGATLSTTNAVALSGAQSLVVAGRTGNSPAATTLTSVVTPGETYQTSFWVSISGAASADVNVTQKFKCVGGSEDYSWLGQVTAYAGEWAEISGDVQVPDCDLEELTLYAEGPGAGIDLYLDHVSMRAPAPAERVNVVANGSFESSGATGWFTWGGASIAATSTRAHSGSQSLLVSARPGNSPAATTLTSAVLPGTTYDVSFWVSIGGAESASVNVTRKIQCAGEDASYSWLGGQVTVADGAWANISGSIAIPNCQLQEFTIYAEGPGAGIDLYLDDVAVLAPPSQVANVIPDGTFESGQGSWFGWGSGTLGVTNARAHGGTQSLASVDRTDNATIARNITALVTPGVTYQGSFWVSVDGIEAGSAAVNVTKKIQCAGEDASYTWLGQVTVANGAWAEIQGAFAVPDCELAEVTLFAEGPSSGSLYVDDVVVSP